ncbi:MAG TPA: hypothetical protein DCE56_25445 [Cyanobacteria bacterium UBA8553]|nr:hypothetical protein [Cyanobacteria bacterium UBA8553]
MSPESHFLIGIPGSGKSTLAQEWVQRDPNCCIVSTDGIRAELYGDEQIQGDWETIEAVVLERVREAIAQGKSVIYDATNAKRSWRITMLQQFATIGATQWIGWHFTTPLVGGHRQLFCRPSRLSPHCTPWNNDFLNQLEQFPDGELKDMVDAAVWAYNLLGGEFKVSFGQGRYRV